MIMEKLGICAFIGFLMFLLYSDYSRKVEVNVCESEGLTQYVNRTPPPKILSVGECKLVEMSNGDYYELKRLMKEGRK